MAHHPLDGCRAKIARAYKLSAFFEHLSLTQMERPPFRVDAVIDKKNTMIEFVVRSTGPIAEFSLELPIVAGEVCHQLRSCLDHLVWQLVIAKTGTLPSGTKSGFPIFLHEEGYSKRGLAMIVGVSDEAAWRIKTVQPFNAPEVRDSTLLWALHELNNTDKHRMIPITVLKSAVVSGSLTTMEGVIDITDRLLATTPLSDGLVVYRHPSSVENMTFNFPVGVAIAFPELGGLRMYPAVALLQEMTDYVDRLVNSFSGQFEVVGPQN